MFDIGWMELLVVAGVAVIVVGPRDLPRMLKTVGQTLAKFKRLSAEFQSTFSTALKDIETEADIERIGKKMQSIAASNPLASNPLADIKSSMDASQKAGTKKALSNEEAGAGEASLATGEQPAQKTELQNDQEKEGEAVREADEALSAPAQGKIS